MTDKRYKLSRRKALAGLATIGAAGAGAGLGTSALFTDKESLGGNSFTAGKLNLRVNVETKYHGAGGGIVAGPSGTVDGEGTGVDLSATDVKPGDWGIARFCFDIIDNPAYLWTCGALTMNEENQRPEPERAVDDTADPASNMDGELAQAMQAVLFYCDPGIGDDHPLFDNPDGIHPGDSGYDIVGRINSGDFPGIGPVTASGSLASVLSQLDNGLPLDGAPFMGEMGAEGRQPFAGGAEAGNPCLCMLLYLPRSVGNEVQTDKVGFDLAFHAVQSRHNDGSVNPCINATTGDDWGKFQFDDEPHETWFARLKAGQGGNSGDGELYIGHSPGDRIQGQYAWPSTFDGSFEVAYDASADEGTITLMDSGSTEVSSATYTGLDDPASSGDGSADELGITAKAYTAGSSVEVSNVTLNETTPTGDNAVTATGDGTNLRHIHITSVDTTVDWTLSGDVSIDFAGGTNENVAVDIHVD